MKDPRTRKQPAANCVRTWQHSVPTWCFLWRLLRCAWLEAALLDRSVRVIKVPRELWESGHLLKLSLAILGCYTIVIHYSHVSIIAASAVRVSSYCDIIANAINRSALVSSSLVVAVQQVKPNFYFDGLPRILLQFCVTLVLLQWNGKILWKAICLYITVQDVFTFNPLLQGKDVLSSE